MDSKNYYEILGVGNNATVYEIETAKNNLKFGNPDTRMPVSEWDKIDEAYDVLSNLKKRKAYDSFLNSKKTNVKPIINKRTNNIKLQKNTNQLLITGVVFDELSDIENCNKILNNQLYSSKDKNKLQINITKYKNQIDLLNKMIDIRYSKRIKNNFELFKNKLEIISIMRAIELANNNLKNVE